MFFQDPRYTDDVEKMAGFTTESLLCLPIRNAEDDVIGVAQVINKNSPDEVFTEDDEKVNANTCSIIDGM